MKKDAFSLFELILVVILIGLVYSLVLNKIDSKKKIQIKKIEDLNRLIPRNKELIVYDRCRRNSLNIEFDFQNIKVYKVENDDLKEIEFAPYYENGELYDVCLRFKKYKNGSNSSYIIKQNDKYIVFYSYFKDSKVFYKKDEAIDAILEKDIMDKLQDEI